jgi:hypothetical protein
MIGKTENLGIEGPKKQEESSVGRDQLGKKTKRSDSDEEKLSFLMNEPPK